jgi:aconitate hydratase
LRQIGVEHKFVEFFGSGVTQLSIADRATIANMCPEYGATIGFFPPDRRAMKYLIQTGRDAKAVHYIEEYLKAIKLFRDYEESEEKQPAYSEIYELDLSTVMSCVSGPKRPQDKVFVTDLKEEFKNCLTNKIGINVRRHFFVILSIANSNHEITCI